MTEPRRVSLADEAAGFEPAEVDLWSAEPWGGLFLTVDVTKPVQDRITALRVKADEQAEVADDDPAADVESAVGLIADLYGAVLVPAPGHSKKRAERVIRAAYENGLIGLTGLRNGFQKVVDASRPT